MFTIATAGHIDHGKSSLVRALTGTDPDRLPEEQEREMTIELGFASFQLLNGDPVGIIDVPGHERFIKTMISGVGAIDMVLMIVAADDGWMPQTQEHLSILKYLGARLGIVVLTKVDLADQDWIELVRADIRAKTKGSFLEGCNIIEFSAVDNRNLDVIKQEIDSVLHKTLREMPDESARLFVDRSFSVAGTGTVVTGTLREGDLRVGQEVKHHPSGRLIKVRSLQSFYSDLDRAQPWIRLAVGLQSAERELIKRGDILYYPPDLQVSDQLAVKITPEPNQTRYIRHNREVILLHGTREIEARLILPTPEIVCDDGTYLALIRLAGRTIAKSGDRFVLRLATPSLLIGGGQVIDPNPRGVARRDLDLWQALMAAATLDAESLVRYESSRMELCRSEELLKQSLFTRAEVREAVDKLCRAGELMFVGEQLVSTSVWNKAISACLKSLENFHQQNRHLSTMPLAQLYAQVAHSEQLTNLVINHLEADARVERVGPGLKLTGFSAGLTEQQEETKRRMLAELKKQHRVPVNRRDLLALANGAEAVYGFLKQNQEIVDVEGVVFLRTDFEEMTDEIKSHLSNHGTITVSEARDITGTTRKVVVPLLEELDRRRVTRRDGDYRKLAE